GRTEAACRRSGRSKDRSAVFRATLIPGRGEMLPLRQPEIGMATGAAAGEGKLVAIRDAVDPDRARAEQPPEPDREVSRRSPGRDHRMRPDTQHGPGDRQ